MNNLHNLSLGRKLAIAFCAFFVCLSLAAGIFLPRFMNSAAESNATQTFAETAGAGEELAYNYSEVSADLYKSGVLIYGNKTTVAHLKRNLVVKGTFTDESGTHSVLLNDSEYTVSVQIDENDASDEADGDFVFPADTVPAGTTIKIFVSCNGLKSGPVTIANAYIKDSGDYPAYSKIDVEKINNIENDYTVQSLRINPSFIVKDENGKEIVNREFYEVTSLTIPETLTGMGSLTVTFNGTPCNGVIEGAEPARVVSASLTVKPSLIKVGDYYKIPDEEGSASRYSAFVEKMDQEEILHGLDLTVYYNNSYRTVEVSVNDNGSLSSADLQSVIWSGDVNSANTSCSVSLSVIGLSNRGSATATAVIPLEAEKVVDIQIKDSFKTEYTAVLNPGSSPIGNDLLPHVRVIYNNDYYNKNKTHANLQTTDLKMEGRLTPTAEVIAKGISVGQQYSKQVKIVYAGSNADTSYEISTPVTFKVTYNRNLMVVALSAEEGVNQTYKSPFNYNDIGVSFLSGGTLITAPISDFIDENEQFVKVTCYSDTNYSTEIVPENGIFNVKIQSIKVQFRYNNTTEWDSEEGIYTLLATIQRSGSDTDSLDLNRHKFVLTAPSLNVSREIYSKDLVKDFSFITDKNEQMDAAQKTIINGIISRVTVNVERNGETVSGLNFSDILNDRSIPISEAGTYRVSFTLGEGDTDEVRWGGVGNVTSADADTTVIYEFTVAPTDIDLEIRFSQLAWEYGADFSSYISVIGTLKGLNEEFNIGTGSNEVDLKYRVLYYLIGGDGTGLEYPKEAGSYYVVVDTLAGGNYNEAQSAAPNQYSGAPKITVKPKQLNKTASKSIVYDGQEHLVSDFVKPDGFVKGNVDYIIYGETKTFNYNDEIADVLDLTGLTAKYTNAKNYGTVTLTIKNSNYVWGDGEGNADGMSTPVEIVILQREHSVLISNVNDYVYGETANTPTVDISAANMFTDPTVVVYDPTVKCIEVDSVSYYAAADFSESTGPSGSNLTTNSDTWAAGTYYVYVITKRINPATEADCELVTAWAKFVISRKTITKVDYTQTADVTYDGNEKTVNLDNWQNVTLSSGTKVNISNILEIKVEGVITGGSATDKFAAGITNDNDGTVKVLHAGEYTITVSFKNDNFDWSTADSSENPHGALTFTYTVKQVTIYTEWADPDFVYDPSGEQQIPVLNYDTTQMSFAVNDNLQLETKVYNGNSATGTPLAVTSKVVDGKTLYYVTGDAGTYYIALTAFTAKTEGGFDYKNNYVADRTENEAYEKAFIIVAAGLNKPLWMDGESATTEEYNGNVYKVNNATYFSNWNDFTYGSNSCMLEFKVVAKVSSKPTYDGAQFTAVTADGGMTDAGEYLVYVYPAANFKWKEGTGAAALTGEGAPAGKTGFVFTFIIEQKEIAISWTNTSLTYNGEKQQPTATASGILYDNASDIIISVSGGQTNANTDAVKNYTATADTITGTRGFNYKLPANKTTTFNIAKRSINVPSYTATTLTYGTDTSLAFTLNEGFTDVTDWSWSTVVSYTISGAYNFDGVNVPHSVKDGNAEGTSFDFGNNGKGQFNFVNAGTYSIKFTVNNNNYCWKDVDGNDYSVTGIEVQRKVITAPALGSDRIAYQHSGAVQAPVFKDAEKSGLPAFIVTYGSYPDYDNAISVAASSAYGTYFVKLQINADQNPLNYLWQNNGADKDLVDNILGSASWGKTEYFENDVSIYLHYAITGQILTITVATDKGTYTFGDNGYYTDADGNNHGPVYVLEGATEGQTNFVEITAKSDDGSKGIYDNIGRTITYTFYSIDKINATLAEGKVDGNKITDLVNGLPWNVGKYGVYVLIDFTENTYADKELWTTFEITKRDIEFKWEAAGSVTAVDGEKDSFTVEYDGKNHTLNATAINVPKKTADGAAVTITLSGTAQVKDVKVDESGNVVGYTISGTLSADNNFSEIYNHATLTVTKRAVSVKGLNVTGHVYGNTYDLTSSNIGNLVALADVSKALGEGDNVASLFTAVIKKGESVVNVSEAGTGTDYEVVPQLQSGNNNYNLTVASNGTFEIVARTITLSLDENATKIRVYGTIYDNTPVYKITWTNKGASTDGEWLVSGDSQDNIFTVDSDAFKQSAAVGQYNVTVTDKNNPNYIVTVTVPEGSAPYVWEKAYEITPATITVIVESVKGYSGTYDGEAHEAITGSATTVDGSKETWLIEKNGTFVQVDSEAGKVTNVGESGDYKVKVTAPNHKDLILDGTVTVSIEKATVTVSVNINIYYGETGPEHHGEGDKWFKQSFDDLKKDGGIYTVSGFVNDTDKAAFADETLKELSGKESFTYGYADGVTYTQGDGVGKYKLTFNPAELTSENYKFVGVDGYLNVSKLPVKVQLTNLEAKYDQSDAPAVETALSITTARKSSYDGTTDIAIPDTYSVIVTVTTNALNSTTGRNTNDVNDYPITATKKSDNYSFTDDSDTTATYTIEKTTNSLSDGYKLFTKAPSYSALDENSANAWVYGLYTDKQTDGYNKSGDQTAVEATFVYMEDENAQVTYTLYKGSSEVSSHSLAELFSGRLGAGDYKVNITFDGGKNYGAVNADMYFRVGKRTLIVKANPQGIEYGDNAPAYTYEVTGYATTEGGEEKETVFGGNSPVFQCNYKAGDPVGKYTIEYKSGATSLDNYTVDYSDSANKLTVGKRNVTIVVDYKESYFDYYNEPEGNKKAKELTFNAVNGTSFYEDKNTVIKLYTDAVTPFDTFKTNNAGDYPIYALYNSEFYQTNYEITVVADGNNKLYDKDFTVEGLLVNGAGVYTIKPAEISLIIDSNAAKKAETPTGELTAYESGVDSLTYDSKYKGFTASVDGMDGVTIYAVYGTTSDVSQMKREMFNEPGTYYYSFKTENPNYKWAGEGKITSSFTINAKGLTVLNYVDNKSEANLTVEKTYKTTDYVLKFVIDGLVSDDDFVNVNASVSAVKISNTDNVFNSVDPFGTIIPVKNVEDKSFTCNLLNAGVYTVTIQISNSNYLLDHTFKFTVKRADLNLYAANTFVQYGTPINNNNPILQPNKTGVDNIIDILAEGCNLAEYYDTYRFAGFTLNKATLDTISKEGAGLFVKNGITFVSEYVAATSKVSDQWYSITVKEGSVKSYNYNLSSPESSSSRLYIIQRRIDITVKGYKTGNSTYAKATYNGIAYNEIPNYKVRIASFFSYDESAVTGWYGVTDDNNLGIVTATSTRLFVNGGALDYRESGYPISVEQSTTNNYSVTYLNTAGKVLNGNSSEADAPVFMVEKKALTISIVSVGGANESTFNVTYGNTTKGLYKVVYDGFVDKDRTETGYNIPQTHTGGEIEFEEIRSSSDNGSSNVYTPWTSHSGAEYTISVADNSTLWFTNYSIKYETATMTVVSRKITVETTNRTYTEDGSDFHNGEYGINHTAPLIFKDVAGNHNNAAEYVNYTVENNEFKDSGNIYAGTVKSNTVFTLEYLVDGEWTSTAPDKANRYQVRITLNGADFVFDTVNTKGTAKNPVVENSVTGTSATFEYEVEKKKLSVQFEEKESSFFGWDSVTDAGVKNITVTEFNSYIMSADYVQRNNEDFTTQQKPGGGYYVIGENGFGLTVYPDGVGSYITIITIKESAQGNYEWVGGGSNVSLSFSISSDILRILTLEVEDWTYLEYDAEVNKINISYDQPHSDSIIFSYQYWHYTGEVPSASYWDGKFDTLVGFAGSQAFTPSLPTDAGTYVLRAQYTGSQFGTAIAYCLFKITPKEIVKPEFDIDNSELNISYNAEQRKTVINYNARAMDYTFAQGENGDGIPMRSGDTVTITAVNADTYIISFTLTDTNNYKWAEGVETENGAVKLTWTIEKATDNEVTVKEIKVEYGGNYEVSAVSKYGGVITYSYAVRKNNETKPSANAQWKNEKPVNAGIYWIKAVCAGTANFETASGTKELTINKATLTATPEGSMTYGDGFVNAVKDIVYSGWKAQVLTVNENVEYAIEGYDGTHVLTVKDGGYVLVVSGKLAVSEGRDETYGFDINNYNIEIENGVFTVNKKDIEVTLDNLTSIYGEEFEPDEVKLTESSLNGLVGEDRENAFEALNITPTVLGDMTNGYYNASAYVLSSVGHENSVNYNVTVRSGIYRVERLDVYVTVDAGGGEFGNVTPAAKTGVYASYSDEDVEELFGELNVEFRYSGTANDGTTINNSVGVPSLAGSYTAVARINDSNFNLVTDKGTPSVAFTVSRKAITESEITVEELKYNGEEQSPVIVDKKHSELYTAEEVAFVNVSDYTVKLTLKDADNYKWSSVEGNEYHLPFSIGRGDNEFTSEIVMTGWSFGGSASTPQAVTLFGDSSTYVYTYSSSEDGEFTRTVPTLAGTYWVKVTVPQSDNYNEKTSEPVSFTIGKRAIKAPVLEVVAEGENANTVYTGERLKSAVKDYDPVLMRIIYEGDLSSTGSVAVYALNAGEYKIYVALNDENNYTWAEGTSLSENNAQLTWTVARKKIAKPTMTTEMYMVNGGTLTFTPDGYDDSTMTIKGNTTSYGGVFKVTVSIRDNVNFEWADGSVEDITFDWVVIGWDTVFIIVVSVLAIIAGISAIAIGIQYLLHKRRAKAEAVKSAAAEKAFHENVAQMAESKAMSEEPSDDNSLDEPAEQTEYESLEELKPEDTETEGEGGNDNE